MSRKGAKGIRSAIATWYEIEMTQIPQMLGQSIAEIVNAFPN